MPAAPSTNNKCPVCAGSLSREKKKGKHHEVCSLCERERAKHSNSLDFLKSKKPLQG